MPIRAYPRPFLGLVPALALALLGAGGPVRAECRGRDIFGVLAAEAPAALAAVQQEADALPFGRGRLFRLTREGLAPSYLFGTLHLGDPRATEVPRPLGEAIATARVLAIETVEVEALRDDSTSARTRAEARSALLASPERRPARLLPPELYARLEAAVTRRGLPRNAAREFKPTVLALLLDLPACAVAESDRQSYADARLAEIARGRSIRVVGIETFVEQIEALDGLSAGIERDLLVSTILQAARAEDILETSLARYGEGRLGALLAWMRSPEPVPGLPAARTPPPFLDRLLDARTRRMRARVLPLLERGGAVVAVGAAHLPGSAGLARLLEEDGFRVEAVN